MIKTILWNVFRVIFAGFIGSLAVQDMIAGDVFFGTLGMISMACLLGRIEA